MEDELIKTEKGKQEAKEFLTDLKKLIKIFSELESKMTSEIGKVFAEKFTEQALPILKTLKEKILIAIE